MKRKKGARGSSRKFRFLITAGPTREPIDPVRYISNYSTGTLGYALARLARQRGHEVVLISGPTELSKPAGIRRIDVMTAGEMQQAVVKAFPRMDALIMGAAVADFRPIRVATSKIKRSGAAGSLRLWQLEMVENPDILAEAARQRRPAQAIIGFALETESLLANARRKLKSKDLDAIVATHLSSPSKGRGPFGIDPVDGAILTRAGRVKPFRGIPKPKLAARILDTVEAALAARSK